LRSGFLQQRSNTKEQQAYCEGNFSKVSTCAANHSQCKARFSSAKRVYFSYTSESEENSNEAMRRIGKQVGQVNKSIRWMPWH
jgi:hypothetical protein